jgi:hypothetical protein
MVITRGHQCIRMPKSIEDAIEGSSGEGLRHAIGLKIDFKKEVFQAPRKQIPRIEASCSRRFRRRVAE